MNIQGLSKTIGKEVKELICENSTVCLTQIQKKIRAINFSKEIKIIDNMRGRKDRKGGIIVLAYKENIGRELEKVQNRCKDVLHVKGKVEGWEVKLLMVYFSVNDSERNNEMKQEIEGIMQENTAINNNKGF